MAESIKLDAVFTVAGINSLLRRKDVGLKRALSHLAFGSSAFKPNDRMTYLPNEVERFALVDGQEGEQLMRFAVRVQTEQEYAVRSVAGFLDDGTMLFAFSTDDPSFLITYFTPFVSGLDVRFSMKLSGLPTNALSLSISDPGSLVFTRQFAILGSAEISNMNRYLKQKFAFLDAGLINY